MVGGFFSVAGPAIWNWLSDSMKDPAINRDSFKRSLKTFSNVSLLVYLAHWSFFDDALYKFTYLLTYCWRLSKFRSGGSLGGD